MTPLHVGITLGDPAGIGPEVVARAMADPAVRRLARFHLIGDAAVFRRYNKSHYPNCEFVDVKAVRAGEVLPGHPGKKSAVASVAYLNRAVEMLKSKEISALVTAPVCKEAIHDGVMPFQGHTEYLAKAFQTEDVEMMFVSPRLRAVTLTRHIPLKQVPKAVTSDKVFSALQLADQRLKKVFGIRHPKIAVCGLNPHAGEGGHMGREEIETIIPAIRKAQKRGIDANGPFSADTLFVPENSAPWDLIVAMYHDQGLIPVKSMYFSEVVNLTLGLPFIRTSPAHGTAFNIAGRNKANPASMKEAIRLAVQLTP